MNPLVEAWGLLGGGLGFLISIPQLVRVVKYKSQVGVSLTTWLFILMSCFGWTAFGFRFDSFSQILTNSIAAVLAVVLSFVLMRGTFALWLNVTILASIAIATVLIVFYAPLPIMQIWLYIALWSRVPQTVTSFRSWRAGRSTIVSMSTYWLSIGSSLAWVVYGVLAGYLDVIIFSAIVAGLSALIVLFELLAQRASKRTPISRG